MSGLSTTSPPPASLVSASTTGACKECSTFCLDAEFPALSEATTAPSLVSSKAGGSVVSFGPTSDTCSKKLKAKDLYNRDVTYEEKQKLSTKLLSLPLEKLNSIVQIIKKSNSALLQQDDEIEVDIDSVDTDTLWELDRFVTNYKKSLSKKREKPKLLFKPE
ncbi:hypothetical protein V6N13_146308 [Hibiscus sabdariffa]